MSRKAIATILIGIIIGGGTGYLGNNYLLTPRIMELEDQMARLSEDYQKLSDDYVNLANDKDMLGSQLAKIQQDYETLSTQYDTLFQEHEALLEQYQLLKSLYKTILSDYEASFGGVPISPDSLPILQKKFIWEYGVDEVTLNLTIPKSLYNYFKDKERYSTNDYTVYVVQPYDDGYLKTLLNEFNLLCVLNNYTEEQKFNLVTSFVQNLHYQTDDVVGYDEYPKFPLETLIDEGGDCEDTAILAASLLRSMNYTVALIRLPEHMAVGVETNAVGTKYVVGGHDYYYLETTSKGWELGSIPIEYQNKEATIFPMWEKAFLSHTWKATRRTNKITVTVTYINESPVRAEGYKAWVGLESRDGSLLSSTESSSFEMNFLETKVVTLRVTGPLDKEMRLMVGFIDSDELVRDVTYSTYFTTT